MKPFAITEDGYELDERAYYELVLEQVGVPYYDRDHPARIFTVCIDHDECNRSCEYFNYDNGVVWSQVMSASDEVTDSRLPRGYWDNIPEDYDTGEYISWIMGDYM